MRTTFQALLAATSAVVALCIASSALFGCSAANTDGATVHGSAGSITSGASGGAPSTPPPNGGTGNSLIVGEPAAGTAGALAAAGAESCATQKADAAITKLPVDIIVVIDNSGSMQDEIDAVAKSINVNFANVLQTSGVDYRVILISRHEKKGRQTSICVTAPLSGNTACPPTPDQPAFTERFYQYSLKVDSLNSLELITSTYNATLPDEFKLAPMGWSAWLRPTATKVFLEITDDNSTTMTSADFDAKLLALSPENFGTTARRKYTFHSIIGIGEKPMPTDAWLPTEAMQTSLCTGNGDTVENAGPAYQELSRLTGGLRFPICQFTAFNTVFETIANNVASHAGIACEFAIPSAPADRELDLAKVAVSYDAGDGTPLKTYGQAMSAAACVPDAFYIDAATQKIELCPEACAAAQNGLKPTINVLFTCADTYVPPPK
ncbi:MAG: hypothetical protein ABUL62_26925 [Myxococcales bacterium]